MWERNLLVLAYRPLCFPIGCLRSSSIFTTHPNTSSQNSRLLLAIFSQISFSCNSGQFLAMLSGKTHQTDREFGMQDYLSVNIMLLQSQGTPTLPVLLL